ncbi:MAG: hypothetical protein E6K58_12865, partial [Nitrospirae bacterium]
MSFTGGGTVVVGVTSFTGVDQTTPLSIFFGAASNGLTASVNVASAPREVVFDTVAVNAQATSLSVGGGQSSRWDVGTGAAGRGAASTEPGAGSVTMSWGISVAQNWAIGAVSIKPADNGLTVDVTHTVSGTNRLLLVGISSTASGGGIPTVSSVQWNATGTPEPLTLVGSQANGSNAKIWIYSLVAPTTGTKTLRVTFSATATAIVGVMSFTGVDQAIPLGAFVSIINPPGQNDPSLLRVPTAPGELVFDTIAVDSGSLGNVSANQTPQWKLLTGTASGVGGGSTAAGAASVTKSWANTSDHIYATGGVSINPVNDPVGADIIFRAFDIDNPGNNICGAGIAVCTLDHEIESYIGTSGTLVAWVRIPVLKTQTASSDTVIYIYYGSPNNTLSTANPTGVWDADFIGVWHLKEATGATNLDSTANGYNGTPAGSPTQGAGQINGALTFASASSQNVDAADVDTVDGISAMTVEGWVKPSSLSAGETVVSKFNADGWRMSTPYGTTIVAGTANSAGGSGTSVSVTLSTVANANLLMAGVSVAGTTFPTISLPVWDQGGTNQNMTLVNCTNDSGNSRKICIYYLLNPTQGSNKTLQVTFTGGTAGGKVVGGNSFSGADPTTPLGTYVGNSGTVSPASVVVTSATGQVVFDTVSWTGTVTMDPSQTNLWLRTSSNTVGGGSTKPGAASVTMQWTKTAAAANWAIGAVPIKPVVPAAADDVRLSFDSNWGETTGNILANGTWGHWVMVFDGSQSTNATRLKFYFNNAAQTLTFTGTIPATTPNTAYTLRLAGTAAATDFIDGILDEVRISDIARSADWISTEYKNVTLLSCGVSPIDATKFCMYGSEENNPPSAVRMRGARAVAYEGAFAQTVQLKWRTGHEVEHLGFHV